MSHSAAILLAIVFLVSHPTRGLVAQELTSGEAAVALQKACAFYRTKSQHGGYVWRYSRDGKLSEGEGETNIDIAWVQPPGTPAIGDVFLSAYQATSDPFFLNLANEVGTALIRGQLQSGGWFYSIHFAPAERAKRGYRNNKSYKARRKGRDRNNITTLDDNTTQAAIRFLLKLARINAKAEQFEASTRLREPIEFALNAVLEAQAPNGGWRQNWDRYPTPLSVEDYPIKNASYPDKWSRKWLNDWRAKYYLNDDVMGQTIRTMLDAWDTYADLRYLNSAKQGGEFLIHAQMPEPQPAWAQQYDENMHPVWDRKFEPPAISGMESRFAIRALLDLTAATKDKRFLAPIPRALSYLKRSEITPGKLARFYELRSNKPLYFDRKYQLTYSADDVPSHYSFSSGSGLTKLQQDFLRVERGEALVQRKPGQTQAAREAADSIKLMDDNGGWLDKRGMKGFGKASQEGVYQSETFIKRAMSIINFLEADKRSATSN